MIHRERRNWDSHRPMTDGRQTFKNSITDADFTEVDVFEFDRIGFRAEKRLRSTADYREQWKDKWQSRRRLHTNTQSSRWQRSIPRTRTTSTISNTVIQLHQLTRANFETHPDGKLKAGKMYGKAHIILNKMVVILKPQTETVTPPPHAHFSCVALPVTSLFRSTLFLKRFAISGGSAT